jgi:hypothetical protein
MKNQVTKIVMIVCLAFFACSTYASPPLKTEDRARETAAESKKKKAGEECKTSDECRRHHKCSKVDNKNICVAPVYSEIPKT